MSLAGVLRPQPIMQVAKFTWLSEYQDKMTGIRILVNSTISSHLDPFRGRLRKGVATSCPHMQDAWKALLDKCGVLACPGMAGNSSREKVCHKATLTSPMRQAKGSSPLCYNRQKKLPMELKPYFL